MTSRIIGVHWFALGVFALTQSCGSSDAGAGVGTGGASGDTSSGGQGASAGGSGTTSTGGQSTGAGGSTGFGTGGSGTGTGGVSNGGGVAGQIGAGGAGMSGGGGMGGTSANCPAAEPMNMTACMTATPIGGGMGCTYAATGDVCTCRGRMGGTLMWRCAPGAGAGGTAGAGGMGGAAGAAGAGGAGGNATNCPMAAPTTGGMCTRATMMGQSNTCTYATDVCTCQRAATNMMSTWACVTCPAAAPMNGSDCDEASVCRYPVNGRTTTCTCRQPPGAGGASGVDGGTTMTWACR